MTKLRQSLALLLTIPGICSAQATISPGLWQISLQSKEMASVQVDQCLTAADANDPSKLLGSIANPGASGCSYTDKRYSGNTFSFAMTCSGALAIKATGTVSFTAITMSGTISTNASINGQAVDMKNTVKAQRIGDC